MNDEGLKTTRAGVRAKNSKLGLELRLRLGLKLGLGLDLGFNFRICFRELNYDGQLSLGKSGAWVNAIERAMTKNCS